MLEAIREHAQGWIAKVILVLITVPFALWGIDWYFQGGGQGKPVASVDDHDISEKEFLDTLQQQVEAMGGRSEDADKPELRRQVVDQLVNARLLTQAALDAGLRVTDAQVNTLLHGLEPFQDNGTFTEAKLDAWLRSRGMSRAAFIQQLRHDMLLRQVQLALGEGAVVPRQSAAQLGKLLSQQREVQEAVFDIQGHLNRVVINDAAVAAEYNAHKQDYATPAQVRVQYLQLSPDQLAGQVRVDEQTARQFYDNNQVRYQEPEQRRASHILIKADATMDAKARETVRAKAASLLREAQANPGRFADLARQHSQDPVSGAQGGDLGAFTAELMVKPFADAVFSMRPGEIRGLAETEFGYHIIRLDGIIPGSQLGFELVKGEIMNELQEQEAQRRFAEAADRFSNLVYEQPDSLESAARDLKLEIKQSGWVSGKSAEPRLLGHPRLLEALFSEEVLEQKHNTEAIEVAPNVLVAARVIEHRPEGLRPLEEVAGEIRLKLTAEAARKMATAAGQGALKAAQAGQAPAGMGAPMTVSRMQPVNLPPEAVKVLFKAKVDKLPAYAGVETREGYRLYRINRVVAGQSGEQMVKLIRRDLQRLAGQEELHAYLEQARAEAKITINQEVVEKRAEQ